MIPDEAVRVLRAKGAELEAQVLADTEKAPIFPVRDDDFIGRASRLTMLAADIALVAQLLADHIERSDASQQLLHNETFMAELREGLRQAHSGETVAWENPQQRANQGYLNSILEVTEFDVGSKEEADYVAALKAECDAYLAGRRPYWGPNHPDYDEMGQ